MEFQDFKNIARGHGRKSGGAGQERGYKMVKPSSGEETIVIPKTKRLGEGGVTLGGLRKACPQKIEKMKLTGTLE